MQASGQKINKFGAILKIIVFWGNLGVLPLYPLALATLRICHPPKNPSSRDRNSKEPIIIIGLLVFAHNILDRRGSINNIIIHAMLTMTTMMTIGSNR